MNRGLGDYCPSPVSETPAVKVGDRLRSTLTGRELVILGVRDTECDAMWCINSVKFSATLDNISDPKMFSRLPPAAPPAVTVERSCGPRIDRRSIFEYMGNQYDTLTELIEVESDDLDLSVRQDRETMRALLDAIDAYHE